VRLLIASDHAGYDLKELLASHARERGHEVVDLGPQDRASVDYPDFAHALAGRLLARRDQLGILVCGTGIGMAIVANKHAGVRAANVESVEAARMARMHNNANVLAIGARLTTWDLAEEIITVFLGAAFEGGRHQRRVDKIHTLTHL
jgi:ribose 5-phosphate isomerase B